MLSFGYRRVFRFEKDGAPQISDFPDSPPSGESDLEIRIKHFTEIENFGFLGYVLAHELAGPAQRIRELPDIEDPDVAALIADLRKMAISDEDLGDELLDACINWEHFVASTNDKMIPGQPLKIRDAKLQAKIDALDELSEALVKEISRRSLEREEQRKKQRRDDEGG